MADMHALANGATQAIQQFTDNPHQRHRHRPAGKAARGLGWFGIGLGLVEVLAPRLVARAVGLHGMEALVRLHGVREIATGLGLLRAHDPTPWTWARVGGDVLDAASLASGLQPGNRAMARTAGALAAVAGVAALDVGCARALARGPLQEVRDYSGRSGLRESPEQMRGKAREDFETPRDFLMPSALRPYVLH